MCVLWQLLHKSRQQDRTSTHKWYLSALSTASRTRSTVKSSNNKKTWNPKGDKKKAHSWKSDNSLGSNDSYTKSVNGTNKAFKWCDDPGHEGKGIWVIHTPRTCTAASLLASTTRHLAMVTRIKRWRSMAMPFKTYKISSNKPNQVMILPLHSLLSWNVFLYQGLSLWTMLADWPLVFCGIFESLKAPLLKWLMMLHFHFSLFVIPMLTPGLPYFCKTIVSRVTTYLVHELHPAYVVLSLLLVQ
jgi:hypothetical protein